MLRRPGRLALITAIVLFWGVMTAVLVHNEFIGPQRHDSAPNTPTDVWLGVYTSDDARIGFINLNSRPEVRDGVSGTAMGFTARLSMSIMRFPAEVIATASAWMPRTDSPAAFEARLRSGGHSVRIEGTHHKGMLKAHLLTAGERYPLQFPVDDSLFSSSGMLDRPRLKVGESTTIKAFDPLTMTPGKAVIKCIATETLTVDGAPIETKVITTQIGAVTSTAWVDDQGEVVRAETPYGFVLQRIKPEDALRPIEERDTESLIERLAVRPSGKPVRRGAAVLEVRLANYTGPDSPPEDDTQRLVEPNLYRIETPQPPDTCEADEPNEAYLLGDVLVQSDHPRIIEKAQDIVQGKQGRWEKALAVYQWVYETLEKRPVVSVPSALDVLETEEGDCNEHTVLFTALARAAGIPTRIAIGLVWSDDLDGFYYHAWPEVYCGQWIWMDPTLGQPIADATHIKLLTGDIEKWFRLVGYLGQLEIHVE